MRLLGYDFKDEALAEQALTTPSCRIDSPSVQDNQRLEFLGDAVLGLLAAETLHQSFPSASEGALTIRRTHMVSTAALCDAAARLDFAARLKRNRGAHPMAANAKTIADAIEAVIGAAYLDGGLDAARVVFATLDLVSHAEDASLSANPKGELQQFTQAMKPPRLPEYAVLATEGTANDPVFTVRARVEGIGEVLATAHSRREAEVKAASSLLKLARPVTRFARSV